MEKRKPKASETSRQLFDSIFWSSVVKMKEFVIPLINEVYNEKLSEYATVDLKPLKHVVRKNRNRYIRREMDQLIRVIDGDLDRCYHFECETYYNKSLAIRIGEYGSAAAFDSVKVKDNGVEIEVPYSAVIILKKANLVSNEFVVTIKYPGGEVKYSAPTIRVWDYSLEDIFEKRLFLLLPFYTMRIMDRLGKMNRDNNSEPVKKIFYDINAKLDEAVGQGILDEYQKRTLTRYTESVVTRLLEKYSNLSKEVDTIMGGRIIDTDADVILKKGIKLGKSEGREEGRAEGREEGREETLASSIKMLMKNMKLTAEQAMDSLEIPQSDRKKYLAML